jgi:hypothetical protein
MVKTPINVAELTDFLPFLYFVADFHCHVTPADSRERLADTCLHRCPDNRRRP